MDFRKLMMTPEYDFLRDNNRVDDLELLLKIREGGFQKEDGTFVAEFYQILDDYERHLETAARNSSLPDNPDMEKVGKFVEYINRRVVGEDF